MTISLIAFTPPGAELARHLARLFARQGHGAEVTAAFGPGAPGVRGWTARHFAAADALVFVGAAGIAVRAIAPHVRSKAADPAVVVVDEQGRFAIPLLSDHLGGAGVLARRIAACTGGQAVLTAASDVRGAFAFDRWARGQNLAVQNPAAIRPVAARYLAGESIAVRSDFAIAGDPPPGVRVTRGPAQVAVTLAPAGAELTLTPRAVIAGIGCRRGVGQGEIEQMFANALNAAGVAPAAVACAATIDRKAGEPGLLAFCRARRLPLRTFSAAELMAQAGDFVSSPFVRQVTGADNVCQRAAAAAGGRRLLGERWAGGGVTLALALGPVALTWKEETIDG